MITKDRVFKIQEKIKKEIQKIEAEENVKIEFSNISFDLTKYSTQMIVKSLDKNEKLESHNETLCRRLGFTQNVIGMKFLYQGSQFEIAELKTRNRKYKVIATDLKSGTNYKFSVMSIKKLLGGDKIINRNKNLDKLVE